MRLYRELEPRQDEGNDAPQPSSAGDSGDCGGRFLFRFALAMRPHASHNTMNASLPRWPPVNDLPRSKFAGVCTSFWRSAAVHTISAPDCEEKVEEPITTVLSRHSSTPGQDRAACCKYREQHLDLESKLKWLRRAHRQP